MDRRQFLRRVAPLGCLGLAGCAGDGSDATTGTETTAPATRSATEPTPTESATAEPTPTASPTRTETRTESPTPTATTTPTATRTPTPTSTPTATPTPAPSAVTVAVGPDDRLRFSPETFELAIGGTVTWEWQSNSHNIGVRSQPDGASWDAHDGALYDEGHTYSHTFDVAGEYEYYCSPHSGAGMVGSFTVR